MKLTLLIMVGLIAMSLGKKSCDEEQPSPAVLPPASSPAPVHPPASAPASAPASDISEDKEVKKWSIKELFSSDLSKKKQIFKIIKVLKLVGFVGVPALKALVDAKLKNIEKDDWNKNMGKNSWHKDSWHKDNWHADIGKDSWHPSFGKDSWNNYEYAAGYDMYGNQGYFPVQKKTGTKFGSLFADKFAIPLALKHKLTKGKF